MKYRRMIFSSLLAVLAVLALPAATGWPSAHAAENFPERDIRIIIGFPPGSSTELSLRALTDVARKYVGKPLVIINRPGGSQAIAFNDLIAAKPDGYTMGAGTDGFRSLTRYQVKLSFDPDRVTTLLGYARFRHVLFVNGESPYRTIEDLLAAARSDPGKISYGGTGQGTAPDLFGKILFGAAKVDVTHVPFKGTNELIPAIVGKHVVSGINDVSLLFPYFKSGQLRPLLVFGEKRMAELPDVPTSTEKGFSKDSNLLDLLNSSLSLFVPRDIPKDRFKTLYDIFRQAALDPDFKRHADNLGLHAEFTEPGEVEQRIAETRRTGIPLLKQLNLYVE